MRATWINVGYGDAILFQADDGYTILLDGGSNLPEEFSGDEFRIRSLDYLQHRNIKHIDSVIISHIHEDHVCGLKKVLEQVSVDNIFVPYPIEPFINGHDLKPNEGAAKSVFLYTNALNDYCQILKKAKGKIKVVVPGDKLNLTKDLAIDVLAPKPKNISAYMSLIERAFVSQDSAEVTDLLTKLDACSNATSMLLKVQTKNSTFLMAADCCPREWNEVDVSMLKNVNVLKLPHHGQVDSVIEEIMALMPLEYVITTASSDRRYNSANPKVYEILSRINPLGKAPEFIFADEREYPPYFSQPLGFNAFTLEEKGEKLVVKFEKIK